MAEIKAVYDRIGQPFTAARFLEASAIGGYATIRKSWGWKEILTELGIPAAPRGTIKKFIRYIEEAKKHPNRKRSSKKREGSTMASVVGASSPLASPPTLPKTTTFNRGMVWLDYDRSSIKGFVTYMLANPVYFTDLSGLPCTTDNVDAICDQYKQIGLVGKTGLKAPVVDAEGGEYATA